jgi:predicted RND superfamily exporter protein
MKFLEWVAPRPWSVVMTALGLGLISVALCVDLNTLRPRLQVDPAMDRLLPPGSEDSAVYDRARATFGDADAMFVGVRFDPVFTAANLERIDRITQLLAHLPDVRSVFSLATAPNLLAMGEDIEISSFTVQAKRDPSLIGGFARQLDANPLYKGGLVSQDGKATAFALIMGDMPEDTFAARDYPGEIRKIVREIAGDAEVWIAGGQVASAETTHELLQTMRKIVPTVFILVAALLLVAFRSIRATLMAAVTVTLALVWTMATAVVLDMPLNLITAIVPPLVVTIGLSYTIHLLSNYFLAFQQPDLQTQAERVLWVMNRIKMGLFLSAATTIAGFLALLLNKLPAIHQFAILSSIGTAYCALLTLIFLPASLNLIGCSRDRSPAGARMFARWAEKLAVFDVKYRGWIIAAAAIIVPINLWFAMDVKTGTEFIQSFDEDSTVRRDFEAINREFNGANTMSIFIETNVTDSLTDPDLIRRLDEFQSWLRVQPEVGAVASYVDYLKLINQGLNENDPKYFAVPESSAAVKQLLIFAGSEDLQRYIDARFRSALIALRINVDGSIQIGEVVERIEQRLRALPPPLNNSHVTGSTVIATRTVHEVARGHFESIAIAVAAMWIFLAIMFTSWRAGLIATLPNLVPIAVYFGALGVLDISLNPTTSMVACIVLGIAVNDTIHYLARFNADARAAGSEAQAVKTAMVGVLRPITLATAALCLGFLAFVGGELNNQQQFGALSAFTLFVAWIADMTVTPALGSKLRIVTLWDLLRLDLGQSPQHTIPLLSGLSLRQARIFALLSHLQTVPSGTLVLKEGDFARDMYVIVDGSVEVWVDRNGETKALAKMSRGAVMGEAGYFGQRRTANVTALTPVRLLRFDSQDLERLRVRYPWIAATIFRNLNRVQAERLARATAMIQ